MKSCTGTTTDFPTRKRARSCNDADSAVIKRARLTEQNLEKHLLRIAETMPKAKTTRLPRTSATTASSSGTSFTTTSNGFAMQLNRNNVVYAADQALPPNDLNDLKGYLDRKRSSESPEPEAWRRYQQLVRGAINEDDIKSEAWRGRPESLAKPPSIDGGGYKAIHNLAWTEVVDGRADVTSCLSAPKPDYCESYPILKYSIQAINLLGSHIQPTSHDMAMPAFAAEVKSRSFSFLRASQQAAYNGAVIVESALATHHHLKQPMEYGLSQAITVCCNGDDVGLYANHAVIESTKHPELKYYSYVLYRHTPFDSYEGYRQSCRHIRNAQDWCRERAAKTLQDLHAIAPGKHTLATPPQSTLSKVATPEQDIP